MKAVALRRERCCREDRNEPLRRERCYLEDRNEPLRRAYDVLNALAVLQPSAELSALVNVLFGIEDRAKLYYISGGKSGGINDKGPGERELMEAAEDRALALR